MDTKREHQKNSDNHKKNKYLGEFEQTVLLAVFHLGDNAYGVTIRRKIMERTGRDVAIGAVYTTLERLQKKNYVSSRLGEPTEERGGRAKRYFKIEALGIRALECSRRALMSMWAGLKPLEV